MYVKLLSGDLNLSPCPPHPINTYTYGMTITKLTFVLKLLEQSQSLQIWYHANI